jgi:hypothetical protein
MKIRVWKMHKKVFMICAAALLVGCAETTTTTSVSQMDVAPDVMLAPGVTCDHIVDGKVRSIKGCEGFIPIGKLDPKTAEGIAALNAVFRAEAPTIVRFALDKSIVTPTEKSKLQQQAAWIRKHPNLRFALYGHTDLLASDAYNFALAKRRAVAVMKVLMSYGVSEDQLDALVSYGETRPVINKDGSQPLNRRVVTEVYAYLEVPRLRTEENLECRWIDPAFLASYPACIAVPGGVNVLPVPPTPELLEPTELSAAVTTAHNTNSVSVTTDEYGLKTIEVDGTAGDGNVVTHAGSQQQMDGTTDLHAGDLHYNYDPSDGSYTAIP